jgi:hypothetical protein
MVCVNKIDLLDDRAELDPLWPYEVLAIPVVHCSAATGQGIERLGDALAGKLCVFAGHSGLGKSSLLNALDRGPGTRHEFGQTHNHVVGALPSFQWRNGDRHARRPRVRTLEYQRRGCSPLLPRFR